MADHRGGLNQLLCLGYPRPKPHRPKAQL